MRGLLSFLLQGGLRAPSTQLRLQHAVGLGHDVAELRALVHTRVDAALVQLHTLLRLRGRHGLGTDHPPAVRTPQDRTMKKIKGMIKLGITKARKKEKCDKIFEKGKK